MASMNVGYARVSTQDQKPELQRDALEEVGCERIFWERISSRKENRPELEKALEYCREGDVLVVWRLDRLGRSLKDLIEIVNTCEERGIGFRSLREAIDTTTSGGRLVFHIFGALAEFERDVIRERTMAGLQAARARGRKGGRRPKLDKRKIELAKKMLEDPDTTVKEVAEAFGVSTDTVYRRVGVIRPERTA
jgi:DNA invertase Pin-like site-specific DNA recombinase